MPQLYWVKLAADGEEFGPFTAADLRRQAAKREILPESLVSLDHDVWYAARRFKGLFEASSAAQRVMDGVPPLPPPGMRGAVTPPPVPSHIPRQTFQSGVEDAGASIRREYGGIFLMLRISAWIACILFLLPAIAGFYGAYFDLPDLQVTSTNKWINISIPHLPPAMVVPSLMALFALLFGAVGLFCGVRSNLGKILLLLGAVLLLLVQLAGTASYVIQLMQLTGRRAQPLGWVLAHKAVEVVFAATFTILCFVAVWCWYREPSEVRTGE